MDEEPKIKLETTPEPPAPAEPAAEPTPEAPPAQPAEPATEAPAAEPAPPAEAAAPAKGGGSGLIIAIVAIAVVAVLVIAFMFMGTSSDAEKLEGTWSVGGGTITGTMTVNNDTANTTTISDTMPANASVTIEFVDGTASIEGVQLRDFDNGKFTIPDMEFGDVEFGEVEGTYVLDGDTLTITISASTTFVDPMDGYFEVDMTITETFNRV